MFRSDFTDSALRIIEQQPEIRVLFTDIQMPGQLDGIELAAKVHERWPHVLLIVTSGRLQLADEEIPDHGRFVSKPYQAEVLVQQVEEPDQQSGVRIFGAIDMTDDKTKTGAQDRRTVAGGEPYEGRLFCQKTRSNPRPG